MLPNYHAYLIRIWRDNADSPWRASVTHVETGAVHRFGSPEQAWAHVEAQLDAERAALEPASPDQGAPDRLNS